MFDANNLLIINGVAVPPPRQGMDIITSQAVDSGRNANGTVVGQLVGRKLYKINNISWNGLTPEQWDEIKQALEPFYVKVTFTDDQNIRRTITMYHGDITAEPFYMNEDNQMYLRFKTCKFNLIDCGIPGEA